MGCGKLQKYLLYGSNLIFMLSGLILLGVGIALESKISAMVKISDVNVSIVPILTMVVGSMVFLVAFIGCCGAIRESYGVLVTYAMFMIVLLGLNIPLFTLKKTKLNAFLEEIPGILLTLCKNDQQKFSDTIGRKFECRASPLSSSDEILAKCTFLTRLWPNGCNEVVADSINTFGHIIEGFCIGVGILELVALVLAVYLVGAIRSKDRQDRNFLYFQYSTRS